MGFTDDYSTTYAFGIAGFLVTVIGWVVICSNRPRVGMTPEERAKQFEQNSVVAFIVGAIKIVIGLILITSMLGGTTWGILLILFGVLWLVRGFRWRQFATLIRTRGALGPVGGPAPYGRFVVPPQGAYAPQAGQVGQAGYPAASGYVVQGQIPAQQNVQVVVNGSNGTKNGYAPVNDNEGEGQKAQTYA